MAGCLRRLRNRRGAAALWLATALVGSLCAGCSARSSPSRFDVVSGTVTELHPDSGLLSVHTAGPWPESDDARELACLLTADTEVYVNDRVQRVETLAAGDAVEIVGYKDPEQAGRFVVSFAFVTRPEAPVAPPDLRPVAAQPSQRP